MVWIKKQPNPNVKPNLIKINKKHLCDPFIYGLVSQHSSPRVQPG